MRGEPLRILYLTVSRGPGGVWELLLQMARHLDPERFAPEIGVLSRSQAPLVLPEEMSRIPAHLLPAEPRQAALSLWWLVTYLRRRRFQILHTHKFHADLAGRVAGALAGTPVILSTRHQVPARPAPWESRLERWSNPLGHRTAAVSEAVRHFLVSGVGLAPERVVTILNGIDLAPLLSVDAGEARRRLRDELGAQAATPVIATVARLVLDKGQAVLLDALEDPDLLGRPWQAWMIGDGPTRKLLERRVARGKLAGRVIFTGHRADVPALLAAADVFVLPSLAEGLPLAVCEAMAMGLPVIATDAGGTAEVVTEGETGRIVPAGDAAALRDALRQALQSPDLRRDWGAAGRRRVLRDFSIARMMGDYQDLYLALLEGCGRR